VAVLAATSALFAAPSLAAPGDLTMRKAKRLAKARAARTMARIERARIDSDLVIDVRRRSSGSCKRRSRRRIDCRMRLRGVIPDPDLGDLPFDCRGRVRVRRIGRRPSRARTDRRSCRGELADLREDLEYEFKRAAR
jgi:hypothetical protein